MNLDIRAASDYPMADLLYDLNLAFEGYLVPVRFSLQQFQTMLHRDSIDLPSSRILLANDRPVGIALIARRGWSSRLAAMGIAKEMRGQRAGTWFMEQLIQESLERGEREMTLEVIEQNTAAVRLYKNMGFRIVRRLVGLVHEEKHSQPRVKLQEIDPREMGQLVMQYGLPDLPWQLSGETVAVLHPPACAYKNENAYIAISNPCASDVVIHSLLVEPRARGKGLALDILTHVMAKHPGRKWHVPAICPEEFGGMFERAGFQREAISQWQMRLNHLETGPANS
ncbi:MAG: GNAT family N-acetyltransferase [Anaerolineales bacterium]|nr:GNAT family N-acetyltransferase [Anaerolineales bacterium]